MFLRLPFPRIGVFVTYFKMAERNEHMVSFDWAGFQLNKLSSNEMQADIYKRPLTIDTIGI